MSAGLESMVRVEDRPTEVVDREKTCPLLLRVFCTYGRHPPISEFTRGMFPLNELQVYTWKDASLKEISQLIKEVNSDSSEIGTYFDFQLITPDLRANTKRFIAKTVGSICVGQKGPDDTKTLAQCRFTIGDYMDVSIVLPNRVPPPSSFRRPPLNRYRD